MSQPNLLTAKEAARELRVSQRTISTMTSGDAPRLKAVRIGRRLLIHRETLEKFIRHEAGLDSAS